MPNPITNFKDSYGTDLGNILITKEYLMSVYPQLANQLITPELWTWGSNDFGQLGNNTITDRSTPVTTLSGGANWKQVAIGSNHTAAIKTDGTLWTWGRNDYVQLGVNDTTQRNTPIQVFGGGTNWKQVSCGIDYTTAIKTDGTLWVWGYNQGRGELGLEFQFETQSTPVTTFAGGNNWKQVSGGVVHTAAIKTDGTLWVWGDNYYGQLGINDNFTKVRYTPTTTFSGGTNWKQVFCGDYTTSAIKTDGTLWTWGYGASGQLGNNNTLYYIFTPVTTFAGGTNWKQVSGGINHTTAIKTDGTLWTWGHNDNGQLGINNTTFNRITPVTTFAGGTTWKQVSCGAITTSAIKTDGTLWVWGDNYSGQLGNNNTATMSFPVTTFAGGTNWKQVAGGTGTVAAIKSNNLTGI